MQLNLVSRKGSCVKRQGTNRQHLGEAVSRDPVGRRRGYSCVAHLTPSVSLLPPESRRPGPGRERAKSVRCRSANATRSSPDIKPVTDKSINLFGTKSDRSRRLRLQLRQAASTPQNARVFSRWDPRGRVEISYICNSSIGCRRIRRRELWSSGRQR